MTKRRQWIVFSVVFVAALVADQLTKVWARQALPSVGHGSGAGGVCDIPKDIVERLCQGRAVAVIDGFWDWRLSMNPGSAFGLFAGMAIGRYLLTIVGIAAVVWIVRTMRKARPDQKVLHWAFALIAAGAVGNLIDRIYFGVVTDFILWRVGSHEWPTFNVADAVLVVGVGLMFIDMRSEEARTKALKAAKQAKARAQGLVKDLQE